MARHFWRAAAPKRQAFDDGAVLRHFQKIHLALMDSRAKRRAYLFA
jgi:hypothetical protein